MANSGSSEFSHPQYTVVRQIAGGARTEVFEAVPVHPNMRDRRVALKVLRSREDHGWFLRIGRVTASLCHPGIVACHEVGTYQEWEFIALEFIPGSDLHERLCRDETWSATDTVRVVAEVAAALDHAHSRGFVHGHLHPKHVLLTADQNPRLIGWGEYPPGDKCFGNPIHQAPEQFLDFAQATVRSDIYALGETAFWMLTGRHPYKNASVTELMAAKRSVPNQTVCQLRTDLPSAVDDVLSRAMAPKPEDRFQSAGEFSEALAAAFTLKTRRKQRWQFWKQ